MNKIKIRKELRRIMSSNNSKIINRRIQMGHKSKYKAIKQLKKIKIKLYKFKISKLKYSWLVLKDLKLKKNYTKSKIQLTIKMRMKELKNKLNRKNLS